MPTQIKKEKNVEAKPKEFLEKLLQTPGVTGREEAVQEVVREYVKDFADEVRTDVMGNVFAVRNPDAPLQVMLAGHCDQIGLGVRFIDSQGFIYVHSLGGWDVQNLIGQHVTIWTKNGPVAGVIGRKPIHLQEPEDRTKAAKLSDIWIDIGTASKEETEKKVAIGDPITLRSFVTELENEQIASQGLDDRAGVWIVMEALRRIDSAKLKCAVYAVSTTQEEEGYRGAKPAAFGINPQVSIAVDVTFASDCPTIEAKKSGEIKMGGGPVIERGPNFSPIVVERFCEKAEQNEIPYQLCANGRPGGTDACVLQMTQGGSATGGISIPNRYMHSAVEVVSLKDLDACADLLARFLEDLDENFSFIPHI